MTAKARKKFRSRIAEAAYETASGLNRIGLIDARTMREFDAACLTTIEPLTGKQILALRGREGVFARVLNAKPKLVSEWERSETKPSGSSLKLFSIAKAHGHAAIS
ncbi:helix-turn-helix domain-containing protein [Methylocystis sp.]|uniref:helix-turn-helix domain-containing protein n=1 Tax=Methylocystis sp. TaxID=1911079 RepID=UPI003D0EF3AA